MYANGTGMKFVALAVLFAAASPAAEKPSVTECFKIQALTKTDSDHYWADWANTCPYTIDSVYVKIGFSDKFRKPLGSGVMGLHFILQGAHRVTRFSTPSGVAGFEFVHVRKVTTDSEDALH